MIHRARESRSRAARPNPTPWRLGDGALTRTSLGAISETLSGFLFAPGCNSLMLHGASLDASFMHMQGPNMRTTLNLDDALLEEARKLTGLEERTALIHEGLRALIARESARRLARLGGTNPKLRPIPRRRPGS